MKIKLLAFFILFTSSLSFAQLTVNDPVHLTPKQLVENELVDPSVVPFNIKFNGSALKATQINDQLGNFKTNFNPTNLGLSKGVLLTTGRNEYALSPNNEPSPYSLHSASTILGESDLALLSGQIMNKCAVLEFDFVATGLVLNFDFVFASEEYPDYVPNGGGGVNDSFGFFLSGPGITGTYSSPFPGMNSKNIALVPNTNIPISISTVNNGYNNNGTCTNCAYYINNSNIGMNPNFSSATSLYTVEYDGFTTPLTAKADLQCGGLYHIKLAVGNATDENWDSAVFLKNFRIPPTTIKNDIGEVNPVPTCFGETVTLSAGTFPAGTQFVWTKDGVLLPDTTATITTTVAGVFCVKIYTPLSCLIAEDCITVTYKLPIPVNAPIDVPLCTTTAATYSFNIDQTSAILGTEDPNDYTISYYNLANTTLTLIKNDDPTGLIPYADLSNYIISGLTATIAIRIKQETTGCVEVKQFNLKVTIQPTGTFSYAQTSYCTAISTSQTVTATVTGTGTYSATPAGLNINASTGAINPSLSLPNSYVVEYNFQTGSCPLYTKTFNLDIIGSPIAPVITSNPSFCKNTTPLLGLETYVVGTNLLWYANATGGTGSTTAPTISTTSVGSTPYYVSQSNGVCEGPRALITVNITPLLIAPLVTLTQPTCTVSTGTILITSAGINFEYSIDNGITYQLNVLSYPNLTNINYVVKYRDAGGCVSEPKQVIFTPALNVPNTPTGGVTFQPNCNTPTGTITIDDTLNPNYQYSKDNGLTYQGLVFSNLTPNTTYTIIAKDMISGCVSQPVTFAINPIPANPIAPFGNVPQQPTCLVPFGKIKITTPVAGTGFKYSKDGINFQDEDEFLNLSPNTTYTIIIQDNLTGCESAATTFLINAITSLPPTPTITGLTQPTCAKNTGGFAVLSPLGAQYEYSRNNGVSYQSYVFFDIVPAGAVYFLTVRDVNTGCVSLANSFRINAALNIPNAPTGIVTFQPNCITPTGTITLDNTLNPTYQFSKDNGVTFQGNIFQNLAPNTSYNFIAKDVVSGCISNSNSMFVNPIPNIPNPPTVIQTITPTCTTPTGTIKVTQPVGTNFMYSKDGLNYSNDPIFAGLFPNTAYNITVKDQLTGCVSNPFAITIDAIPSNPNPAQGVVTQPTCINPFGKIKITTPVAGTGFMYSKDGIIFQSQDEFLNLSPNTTYSIYIKNIATGCVSVAEIFNIDPTILPPAKPIATGSNVCEEDTIMLSTPTVTGAIYYWTGPNGFVSSDQNPQIVNATLANEGIYKVTITLFADCPSLPGEVVINVNELPKPELNQNEYICSDVTTNTILKPTLDANLNDTDYHFEWFKIENGNAILINSETQNYYLVNTSGVYGTIAINNTTGCISEMVTSTVSETSPPKDINIVTSDYFSDVQSITVNVEPVGDYEYQIDNGAFQTSNVFNYITSGSHIIKVKNECDEKSTIASIVDFPKFFTPNGDNYNDRWNIFDLNGQANSKIYIFDRFGKLLKEISPKSQDGWDGTIDNVDLPASDYWFSIFYEENGVSKVFKSHFALKR